jgi:hypothetical protein
MLPAKMAGLIEYRIGRHKTFYPFGGPMNGQTARLEMVRSIIESCEIEQIIETGTYRGTTTEWFSQFGIPVFSAELQSRFASFAQNRMAARSNVHVENIDSVAALERWSQASDVVSKRTLFYLDAHWERYLPLRKELEIISRKFSSWTAVIDDFKVPEDAGYGFDDYGAGRILDMDYIRQCKINDVMAFFPNVRSEWETGAKRGCVVLTANKDLAEKCRALPLLQAATVL